MRVLGTDSAKHYIPYIGGFSMLWRVTLATKTSLLKAIGCKKGQNRFCPAATGRIGQKWAADLGRLSQECARARPAGRPAVAAAAVSLLPYCTHTLSAAVQNRDEKTRMREDMNCYFFTYRKTKCMFFKIIFLFLLSLSKYLDNKQHFVICVAEQHLIVAFES